MVSDNPVDVTPFQQSGAPTPYATPPLCTVSGTVTGPDGSAWAYATVTFNSHGVQVLGGIAVQPFMVSASTDVNGNLAAINLAQGLMLQVRVSYSGVTYPPSTAFVPAASTANFSDLFSWGG
jgi:hypothetical protein